MARSVIRQPNGLYAVWHTGSDEFEMVEATEEEVEALWIASAVEQAIFYANHALKRARGEALPPPAYDLAFCVELAEANNPQGKLLPLVVEMLEREQQEAKATDGQRNEETAEEEGAAPAQGAADAALPHREEVGP